MTMMIMTTPKKKGNENIAWLTIFGRANVRTDLE